jgi:hypothetical protein
VITFPAYQAPYHPQKYLETYQSFPKC